jgi:inhibitor of cysteine peptidase
MSGMTLHLREADNGTSVRVPLSEEVVLELVENPTTGYRWTIETTGDAVKEVESAYVPSSAAIGGGGRSVFRFIAERRGTAEIHAALRRPWETLDHTLNQFTVTITIEGGPDGHDQ